MGGGKGGKGGKEAPAKQAPGKQAPSKQATGGKQAPAPPALVAIRRLRSSAVSIQARVRGLLARGQLMKELRAGVTVQAGVRGRAGRQRAALQREQKGRGGANGPRRRPPPVKVSAKPPAATKPPAAVKSTRPAVAKSAKSVAGPPVATRAGPPVAKKAGVLAAKSPEPPVVKRSSLDDPPVQRSPPPQRPLGTALGAPGGIHTKPLFTE